MKLTAALDGLSDEHREVIALRDIEGLSAAEAAEVIGISVDALKSRLHRARDALRQALRPLLEPSWPAAPKATASWRTAQSAGCPDVVALWSKKLEGELRPDDCVAMEKHLEGCTSCAGACDALRRMLAVCQRSAADPVSPALRRRIMTAVRSLALARP